jgi:oxygen-independent coproporphyrinogen III oxidase
MAGLYIHIPFCKKACYYCDFHFVASLKNKTELLNALRKELISNKEGWESYSFDTLYLGGGTPSVLTVDEIRELTDTIFSTYRIANNFEYTIEANPDDLTIKYIDDLKKTTPINRFSIGVQSFQDNLLHKLNRRHTGEQAKESIQNVKKAGFDKITMDLIYGIPGLTDQYWSETLETFINLGINHLSAYHLSIEPKTAFYVWQKKNRFKQIHEEQSQKQYKILVTLMKQHGFMHYEISNFAKNGEVSRHNTSYWKGVPYLGIGPSAHSYQNYVRRWNVANNTQYIASIGQNLDDYFEMEYLSEAERYNDYMLISLRTIWGADLSYIQKEFSPSIFNSCLKALRKIIPNGMITEKNGKIVLTEDGWFISDLLISEFFITP